MQRQKFGERELKKPPAEGGSAGGLFLIWEGGKQDQNCQNSVQVLRVSVSLYIVAR
jgi:hypothetical protein